MKLSNRSLACALAVLVIGGSAGLSQAEEQRKNLLDGQPAVRHRILLVNGRFELTPLFESSVNAEYYHTVGGGLKAEYHLGDMFSIGVLGVASTSLKTGLTDRILSTLPESVEDAEDPTPARAEYEQHLNKMPLHGAAYVSLTPWYGKLAAFGKAFVNFDFYFQGGVAFAQLTNDCESNICDDTHPGEIEGDELPDNDPNNDPSLNDGNRFGVYLGGGVHVFLNDFIALDLSVRDYLFSDNPSGLDFSADLAVKDDDSRFLNHLFMGVGISFFLPPKAKRTR
jgi:outer membrane beta-barrel protein